VGNAHLDGKNLSDDRRSGSYHLLPKWSIRHQATFFLTTKKKKKKEKGSLTVRKEARDAELLLNIQSIHLRKEILVIGHLWGGNALDREITRRGERLLLFASGAKNTSSVGEPAEGSLTLQKLS